MVSNSELDGTLRLVLEYKKGAVETLTFLGPGNSLYGMYF